MIDCVLDEFEIEVIFVYMGWGKITPIRDLDIFYDSDDVPEDENSNHTKTRT